MRNIDFDYLASGLSALSRIPIRVYRSGELEAFHDPSEFSTDPASIYTENLLNAKHKVSYFITPYEHFYGIIKCEEYTLILGPTFQMSPSRGKIKDYMFELGIKENFTEAYMRLLDSITPMPLELFLHELCLIYYFITEEKLSLTDVALYDSEIFFSENNSVSTEVETHVKKAHSTIDDYADMSEVYGHTTVEFERRLISYVENGDLTGLQDFFHNTASGRAGKVAPTYLRQTKNIFITSTTLISRAAIRGGLPAEEALTLSDQYIQHAENYNNPEQIMNLQYHMVLDYTSLVQKLKQGSRYDKFIRNIIRYIREHLTDDLSVETMAKDLYVNRTYLSTKFKKETGYTLTEYIQMQRIDKAKELLLQTDRSILEIATYLGFSSQGYFQNVFKKQTGLTPKEFRNQ